MIKILYCVWMNARTARTTWPLKLLRTICPSDLLEEIEGDVLQKFEHDQLLFGDKIATRKMLWNVVRFARPGIIFRHKLSGLQNRTFMIPYYFQMAWRNIAGSKFYSGLNLLGLTLGLAVGLLILLWVRNETSHDAFHSKADRIYRMNAHLESNGDKFAVNVVQAAIGARAAKEVPGIENVVRITSLDSYSFFSYGQTTLKANAMRFIDPSFFKMFDFELIKGDRDNPFPDVHATILTESEAKRFFGDQDPIGKTLISDNKESFVVSGVLRDFPSNSSITGDMLFSTALRRKMYTDQGRGEMDDDWGNYGWDVFLQVAPGTSIAGIESNLTRINVKNQPDLKPTDVGFYTLQPLKDIHLYAPDGKPTVLKTVNIFSIVAVLVLLIASINYINLTTARALLRSKEVSVRKITGASRSQLFGQFIVQTFLFFSIAVVLAFCVMGLSMPFYNTVAGKQLQFDPFDIDLWKIIGITLGIVLLVSSIYPSLVLSSFEPIHALRSRSAWRSRSNVFRKVLVIGQFAFSIGLIICTMIIGKQLDFMLERDLGVDKENVFTVQMDNMSSHYESAKGELLANSGVQAVSCGNGNIVNRWGASLDVDWDGKDPDKSFFIADMNVDQDFIPLFNMTLTSGANFTGSKADSSHFILNETAVKEAGIKDPIGKRFRWHDREGTILGVVKDFHFTPLTNKISPFVFYFGPSSSLLYVKTKQANTASAIEAVRKIWSAYNPGSPFEYTFVDDTYNKHYVSSERTSKLFSVFTGVAIVISCLGLLGLITYTAQVKVKEIGIRKIMGATAAGIVILLSRNFLVLMFTSMVIAIPSAWWIMREWLADFAYKTAVPWWLYGVSCGVAIGIALLTIGFQAMRAAIENPIKSLRE